MPFHRGFVTRDGASISAALVAVSAIAAVVRDLFIALVPRLVPARATQSAMAGGSLRSCAAYCSGRRVEPQLVAWPFLSQFFKLTSNACAPRDEARPSVWPARY